MSIEKRVKPSAKVVEAIGEKRKTLLIVCAAIVAIALVCIGGYAIYERVTTGPEKNLTTDVVAVRTMLSSKTSYEGTWVAEDNGLFEVYLPGEKLDTSKEYSSMAVVANRMKEYEDNLIDAYGVYVSEEQVDIDVDDDPFFITDIVKQAVLDDISKACASATSPSGAYDIDFVTLEDGRMAMKLVGDVQMNAMVKSSEDAEPEQTKITYEMEAYVTIEKGTPVVVWCTYDGLNETAKKEAPAKLLEVANTVWKTKSAENILAEEPTSDTEDVEDVPSDVLEG